MNQLALVLADIMLSREYILADISVHLEKIKQKKNRWSGVGVSPSTISRLQKRDHFTFDRNRAWRDITEAVVRELGMITSAETFEAYVERVGADQEVQAYAQRNHTRRYKRRRTLDQAPDWSPVEHLFGIWQTINFSTYFDERPEHPEALHLRSGLRFIGKHTELEEGRLRMKVFDLGKTTFWEGSADHHQAYIYMRMREVSGMPHKGERMYNIYGDPGTHHEITTKQNGEYLAKGVVQVVVRASSRAGINHHLFYGVSVIRFLPGLSEAYANIPEKLARSHIEALPPQVRNEYCFREPVDELESDVSRRVKSGEQYHKLSQIAGWMREPKSLDLVSHGCFSFDVGTMLDLS